MPPAIDWQAKLSEHDRWLRTIVFARVGEAQAVDEVMQEVALAAVRQAAPIADVGKVAPWLYQLAVRQSLMYRRKCGRQRKLNDRFVERQPPQTFDEGVPDPLSWLLADERKQMIRKALQAIPRRDAEILLLKYTESWSYHQIAEHLGVSHSAVESRLHRARAKMRSELLARQLNEVD